MGRRQEWVSPKSDLDEANRFRERVGVFRLDVKERKCLRCDRSFPSEHNAHRMCEACRKATNRSPEL